MSVWVRKCFNKGFIELLLVISTRKWSEKGKRTVYIGSQGMKEQQGRVFEDPLPGYECHQE